MIYKILALGDVVGEEGTNYICRPGFLSGIRRELGADIIIANGENSAKANGMTTDSADRLLSAGVDILTGGNHTWQKSQIYHMLENDSRLIRPANFPGMAPGMGYTFANIGGSRVLVFNLSGNAFMNDSVASPFECADKILKETEGKYDISVLDFHAEATSEKIALARYLDGRVSVIFGTHTHVQTADAEVLPGKTGYITDLGMCGSMNGVLGVRTDCIIHKFTVHTPCRFEEATGNVHVHGALFGVDAESGKCIFAKAIKY